MKKGKYRVLVRMVTYNSTFETHDNVTLVNGMANGGPNGGTWAVEDVYMIVDASCIVGVDGKVS